MKMLPTDRARSPLLQTTPPDSGFPYPFWQDE